MMSIEQKPANVLWPVAVVVVILAADWIEPIACG